MSRTAALRRALLGTGVVAMAGLVLLVPAPADAAGDVVAVGWWTDRATAAELGPEGLEVAASFDGTSVAAVSLTNAGAFETATLVLTEGGVPPAPQAAITGCVIAPGWVSADGGPLADAPAAACEGGFEVTRNLDRTWSVDLTALLPASGQLDLALVPAGGPLTGSPLGGFDPGFVASFASASLVIAEPDAGVPSTVAPTTAPPTTAEPGDGATAAPTTSPPTTLGRRAQAIVPSPVPPPALAPTTLPAPPVTQVAPPVDESAAEELSVPSLTNGPISGSSGDGKPWIRLLALVPLSAAAGIGTVFANRFREAPGAA